MLTHLIVVVDVLGEDDSVQLNVVAAGSPQHQALARASLNQPYCQR